MSDRIFYPLTAAIVTFLIVLLVIAFSSSGDKDTTCPDYGTVPVSINGGEIICVPWEKVQDFNQFED